MTQEYFTMSQNCPSDNETCDRIELIPQIANFVFNNIRRHNTCSDDVDGPHHSENTDHQQHNPQNFEISNLNPLPEHSDFLSLYPRIVFIRRINMDYDGDDVDAFVPVPDDISQKHKLHKHKSQKHKSHKYKQYSNIRNLPSKYKSNHR